MLGTIVYALLDISFNTTIWLTKKSIDGIYAGINYIFYTDEDADINVKTDTENNNRLKEQIELLIKQNEEIKVEMNAIKNKLD